MYTAHTVVVVRCVLLTYSGVGSPQFGACSVVLISRVPLVAADVLVLVTTWVRLGSRDTLRGPRLHKRLSLADILLREGGSIHVQV